MLRLMISSTLLFSVFSASHAGETKVHKSIAYSQSGSDRNQTSLDLYQPESGSDLPIMIFIHGGAWKIGDKARVEQKPEVFSRNGFLFVSINYRLHPETDYKGQGEDVAQAIHWVHEHAKEYGGSRENIFLMGHSAGAHLAALVATDESYLQKEGMDLNNLKGVVLLDGAGYDIPRQIELAFFPRMKNMYRTVFTDDPAKQKAASPIQYVAKGKGIPPFLILHIASRRDSRIQSEQLGDLLTKAGGFAKVVSAEDKSHGSINREIGEADDPPTKEIFDFLNAQLSK